MKKFIFAAIAAGVMVAGGCSCKSESCKTNSMKKECDRCYTEYCKYIGTRLADPRVRAGEEVTFEDGTVIRNVPKDKITKWETPAN